MIVDESFNTRQAKNVNDQSEKHWKFMGTVMNEDGEFIAWRTNGNMDFIQRKELFKNYTDIQVDRRI